MDFYRRDAGAFNHQELRMNCKHRWEPSNFGIKYRTPNHYLYQCTRCSAIIGTLLKEKNA